MAVRRPWIWCLVGVLMCATGCASSHGNANTDKNSAASPAPGGGAVDLGGPWPPMSPVQLNAPVRARGQLTTPLGVAPPVVSPPGRVFTREALRFKHRYAHWTLVARTGNNRYLLIKFIDGPCDPLAGVQLRQRHREMALIPILGQAHLPCALLLQQAYAVVDLGAPLGDRQLLDPT